MRGSGYVVASGTCSQPLRTEPLRHEVIPPDIRTEVRVATIRIGDGSYHVRVLNPDRVGKGVTKLLLNGSPWREDLPLPEPGQTHEVEVHLGNTRA